MERTWFPIYDDLLRDPQFIPLTPAEKLFFWVALSEKNWTGDIFYKPDDWFAAILSLSEIMIRKARRKIAQLGMIEVKPGHKDKNGRNVATTYINVAVSNGGTQFSQLDRTTFFRLIDSIRSHQLSHSEVVAYVYINHLVQISGGRYASVSKRDFIELSGMKNALKQIQGLHEKFRFSSGEALFDLKIDYRGFRVSGLNTIAFNEQQLVSREKAVANTRKALRNKKEMSEKKKRLEKGALTAADLPEFYSGLHEARFGKEADFHPWEADNLIEQGKQKGIDYVKQAIVAFIAAEQLPQKYGQGKKSRSLYYFLRYIDTFIQQAN